MIALSFNLATDSHNTHIGKNVKFVGSSGLHIDKIVFVTGLRHVIKRYLQLTIEHIETLLHIGMDMCKSHLTGSEVGGSNLGKIATGFCT